MTPTIEAQAGILKAHQRQMKRAACKVVHEHQVKREWLAVRQGVTRQTIWNWLNEDDETFPDWATWMDFCQGICEWSRSIEHLQPLAAMFMCRMIPMAECETSNAGLAETIGRVSTISSAISAACLRGTPATDLVNDVEALVRHTRDLEALVCPWKVQRVPA